MVASPDSLQIRGKAPRSSGLNRRAGIIVVAIIVVAVLLIGFFVLSRRQPAPGSGSGHVAKFAAATDAASGITGVQPDALGFPAAPTLGPPVADAKKPALLTTPPAPRPASPAAIAPAPSKSPEETERDAERAATRKAAVAARLAATPATEYGGDAIRADGGADSAARGLTNLAGAGPGSDPGVRDAIRRLQQLTSAEGGQTAAVPTPENTDPASAAALRRLQANLGTGARDEADQNRQQEKADFLAKAEDAPEATTLLHTRKPPLSRFELQASSIIPAVMVGGINSDLPGQILAQIRENVFDSATGRHLLIPQGAKLLGTYQSSVSYAQDRLVVVWSRIIYPDGSSLDLQGMPGIDQEGYSGLEDQVDNHLLLIIGSAVLSSVFTAGVEVSQLQQQPAAGTNGISTNNQVGQSVGSSVGQSVGQLGTEAARKNLSVQPTIIIRNGDLFNVFVTKDIVFPGEYTQD
jgi:type IV secretory pathway VirB10-like protein